LKNNDKKNTDIFSQLDFMQNLLDFMQNVLFSTTPKSRNITREMSTLGIENAYICIHTQ
jgi:hypothetical protein